MYEIFLKLLKKTGDSTYRVAKTTGINFSTFTEWKKGTYKPKVDKLQKIANYFGVPLEYILTGKEERNDG